MKARHSLAICLMLWGPFVLTVDGHAVVDQGIRPIVALRAGVHTALPITLTENKKHSKLIEEHCDESTSCDDSQNSGKKNDSIKQ
jgi:hypothetical protein